MVRRDEREFGSEFSNESGRVPAQIWLPSGPDPAQSWPWSKASTGRLEFQSPLLGAEDEANLGSKTILVEPLYPKTAD